MATVNDPVAGFKSTEFYATAVYVLSTALGVMPEKYAVPAAALIGVYVACRTLLKALHTAGLAKGVPDLPEVPATVTDAIDNRGSK